MWRIPQINIISFDTFSRRSVPLSLSIDKYILAFSVKVKGGGQNLSLAQE